MFGVSGVEFLVILLVALIVLGPEKLPDAVRKTGRVLGELRRMSNGFQAELRDALDEPYREVKGTFDSARQSLRDTADSATAPAVAEPAPAAPAPAPAVAVEPAPAPPPPGPPAATEPAPGPGP